MFRKYKQTLFFVTLFSALNITAMEKPTILSFDSWAKKYNPVPDGLHLFQDAVDRQDQYKAYKASIARNTPLNDNSYKEWEKKNHPEMLTSGLYPIGVYCQLHAEYEGYKTAQKEQALLQKKDEQKSSAQSSRTPTKKPQDFATFFLDKYPHIDREKSSSADIVDAAKQACLEYHTPQIIEKLEQNPAAKLPNILDDIAMETITKAAALQENQSDELEEIWKV